MIYVGNLIYAAIFSDAETYSCNVKRLLYRDMRVAGIYKDKADQMNFRGCSTILYPDLDNFEKSLDGAGENELAQLALTAEDMQKKEDREECRIW